MKSGSWFFALLLGGLMFMAFRAALPIDRPAALHDSGGSSMTTFAGAAKGAPIDRDLAYRNGMPIELQTALFAMG